MELQMHRLKKCSLGLGAFSMLLIFSFTTMITGFVTLQWAASTMSIGIFIASAIMLDYYNRDKKAIKAGLYVQKAVAPTAQVPARANNIAPVAPAVAEAPATKKIACPKCQGIIVVDLANEAIKCESCGSKYKNPLYKG